VKEGGKVAFWDIPDPGWAGCWSCRRLI